MAYPALSRTKTLRRQKSKAPSKSADFDLEYDHFCAIKFEYQRLSGARHHEAAGGGTRRSSMSSTENEESSLAHIEEGHSSLADLEEGHSAEWDSHYAATCDGLTKNQTHLDGPSMRMAPSPALSPWEEAEWVSELAESTADVFGAELTFKHWLKSTGGEDQPITTGKERIDNDCGDDTASEASGFSFTSYETCDSHSDCDFSFCSHDQAAEANSRNSIRTGPGVRFTSDTFTEASARQPNGTPMASSLESRRPRTLSAPAKLPSASADPWVTAELGNEEEDTGDLLRKLDSCSSAFSSLEIQDSTRKMGHLSRRRLRNASL